MSWLLIKIIIVISSRGYIKINMWAGYCSYRLYTTYVTDTIPLNKYAVASEKISVMSIAPMIAEAIKNVHEDSPMSHLFDSE